LISFSFFHRFQLCISRDRIRFTSLPLLCSFYFSLDVHNAFCAIWSISVSPSATVFYLEILVSSIPLCLWW
jgi:hypothetical protein